MRRVDRGRLLDGKQGRRLGWCLAFWAPRLSFTTLGGIPRYARSLRNGRAITWVLTAGLAGSAVVLVLYPGFGASTAQAASSRLETARIELREAKAELRALQEELDKLAHRGEEAEAKLDHTQGAIAEVRVKMDKAEEDLAALRGQLFERLVELYKNRGSDAVMALNAILGGEDMSLDAVAQRMALVGRVAAQDREVIAAVEAKLSELRELTAELRQEKKTKSGIWPST